MKDFDYTYWFLAIIISIQATSCSDSLRQQDIVRELREIKYELKVKK